MSNPGYVMPRWGCDGPVESSACIKKWWGTVGDDSKYRPSWLPMQPSVQYGSSMGAMGVP